MKQGIHPDYRVVVFKDISTDYAFLGKSTIQTTDTTTWEDGNDYPLVKLEISSDSHPFFTGKQKFVDAAGRVDKFYSRYGKGKKEAEEEAEAEKAAEAKPEAEAKTESEAKPEAEAKTDAE